MYTTNIVNIFIFFDPAFFLCNFIYILGCSKPFPNCIKRLFFNRSDNLLICQVQPLPNGTEVNTAQRIKISWADTDVQHLITDSTFTYKPDPKIKGIHPNIAIARYESKWTIYFKINIIKGQGACS